MSNDDLIHSSDFDWTGRKRESAVRCFIGKIYMAVDGRNAWHSTWVRRYRPSDSFHTSLLPAERSVESRRVQGSTWLVREVPAIIISGARTASYIFEINNSQPFDFEPPDFGTATTVFTLTKHWGPSHDHQVFRRTACTPAITIAQLPFSMYTSKSVGRNYYLSWNRLPNAVQIDGIMAHVSALTSHLQKRL